MTTMNNKNNETPKTHKSIDEQIFLDHVNSKIIVYKKFLKSASILDTPEYKKLMEIMDRHPSYKVEARAIKSAQGKLTYKGLNEDKMKEFIEDIHKDDEATKAHRLAELDSLVEFYDKFHASKKAPAMKAWFLGYYKEQYRDWKKANGIDTEDKAAA